MLELRNLKKSYKEPDGGDLPILDVPRWSVDAGEQVVVVGPSGCGKTTLLHIIAGILRPTSGQVLIDGWNTAILNESERDQFRARRIGYVFQTFNLLPGFTALENVQLGMAFAGRGHDRKRAINLLERVGLGHRLHHKPGQMSVGEQQRVSVARALANKPKLVLADEPTANVDVGNQQLVVDMLRNTCRDENVALILVTHSPAVADQFERVDLLTDVNLVAKQKLEEQDRDVLQG
ncbi:MAG: ABC transporter ATP-binding protein [Thermoguttaceae bacterium]|nr:ABC transporter ATP-binding protein [Thermoguttaceae bacterium]MBR4750577.1 ABC transporter ATP-binding protein [Thermoguttaceae bacterium]